jgi:hypothetical protein
MHKNVNITFSVQRSSLRLRSTSRRRSHHGGCTFVQQQLKNVTNAAAADSSHLVLGSLRFDFDDSDLSACDLSAVTSALDEDQQAAVDQLYTYLSTRCTRTTRIINVLALTKILASASIYKLLIERVVKDVVKE